VTDDTTDAPRRAVHGALELFAFDGAAIRRMPLAGRESVTIGRGEDADLVLENPSVSRLHARVRLPGPTIEDLGSANGISIGGVRLAANETRALPLDTVVVLGEVHLVLRNARSPDVAPPPSKPSATMAAVWELVDLVAPSDLPVLILGETGVGKEVVAQAIHDRSKRANGSMLKLNCAALSETTLESELFGHERGAFTGAQATKPGLFEIAHGGTIVLDEVGELQPAIQAKLLRALDTGEIVRLGALKPRTIDVRVIASTNRDIVAMVRAGTFRADLLFRLDGMTIHVPPLRLRRSEIRTLAKELAGAASKREGVVSPEIEDTALVKLDAHDWPGNVRELKRVVERALVLSRYGAVRAEHVVLGALSTSEEKPEKTDLRGERERAEIDVIRDALAACDGNQTRAAEKLGISRRTLVDRMTKYGLPRPRKG
jgi:transcriptional regulator with PAS, ATPase and Fis domain